MSSRLSKLRPGIVVSGVAVFIFLSVSSAEQRTRCYWCGPLAEQVHRSQRAPSCDQFHLDRRETACDPGYPHCATIALAPPYTESRLCVKFYQDECYSLYCNSTKTWRMVCACRGDLCNGPHTTRETQAFALLPKFTKTKPHKRNFVSHFVSVKTKSPAESETDIIFPNETNYDIQSDQPIQSPENNNLYIPTPKHVDDTILIVHGNLKNVEKNTNQQSTKVESIDGNIIHSVEETIQVVVGKHNNTKTDKNETEVMKNLDKGEINKTVSPLEVDKNNTTVKHSDDADLDKNNAKIPINNVHVDNSKEGKNPENSNGNKHTNIKIENLTGTAAEVVEENHDTTIIMATTTTKPTAIDNAVAVQSSAKPEKMPPAEALQQNVTPTKVIELTTATMGTGAMITEIPITEPTPTEAGKTNKKNNGPRNLAHVIIFVVSFLLNYCI